jgi:hypothetical protein
LANIALLPFASVLLFLIPVSLLLQYPFGHVPVLHYLLNRTLEGFISIVRGIDRLSCYNISGVQLDVWDTLTLYPATVLLVLLIMKKRGIYFYILLMLMAFRMAIGCVP